MKAITAQIDHGIDPIAIGAQGTLWKDMEMTLAGVGEAARIPIDRAGGGDALRHHLTARVGTPAGAPLSGPPGRGDAAGQGWVCEPGKGRIDLIRHAGRTRRA